MRRLRGVLWVLVAGCCGCLADPQFCGAALPTVHLVCCACLGRLKRCTQAV